MGSGPRTSTGDGEYQMIDYHIHPDYSADARGSILEYCERAREIGIKEICFTTHYEPDPIRAELERVIVAGQVRPVDSDWVDFYLADIENCRRRFPQIIIRAGVEVGYELGLEGVIFDFIQERPFDFVLGAIHCLDHIAITASQEWEDFRQRLKPRGGEFIARRYFEYVRAAAGCGLFDCLAHIDIWRKYILPEMGEEFLSEIEKLIPQMIQEIVRSGVALEINTSGLRRSDVMAYPAPPLLAQLVDAGVRKWTIGSDAHQVSDLGRGVKEAEKLLSDFGLQPVRFEARRPLGTP